MYNKKKKALITGISGQDGSYIAELLLGMGYEVHGIVRRASIEDPERYLWRIVHLLDKIHIHVGSVDSYPTVFNIIEKVRPDEVYHLAASSFVVYSPDEEISVLNSNVGSTMYILSALKEKSAESKLYFACSSEVFGKAPYSPQNENTPFNPRSIYGISKATGFYIVKYFRQNFKLFCCSGIAYNHESPRRGFEYVTRKITSGVAKIKYGLSKELRLGNLDARRDWGYSPDFVRAMWMMLQRSEPEDYVIATGKTHSVRDIVEFAFDYVGLDWRKYVVIDPALYRPQEDVELRGDYSKIKKDLSWEPTVDFYKMLEIMLQEDLKIYSRYS